MNPNSGQSISPKQAAVSFFFAGLLPVIAFTVIEDQFGTWAGLLAGCVFGLGEIIYEKIRYNQISKMTKFGNGLLIALGLISLLSSEGLWFKLQPALMEGLFALALWGSRFTSRPLLQRLIEMQGQKLPEPLVGRIFGLTFRIGLFFAIQAGLATWAALDWTTQNWALLKGFGVTISMIIYMVAEGLFLRWSIQKRHFIWIFGLLFFSGCGKLDLAVRWADTYVLSSINDYFELSASEKEETRLAFKQILNSIQSQDFPVLAERLDSLAGFLQKNDLRKDLSQAQRNDLLNTEIRKFFSEIGELLKKTSGRFEPLGQLVVANQAKKGFHLFDEEFLKKYNQNLLEMTDQKKQKKTIQKKINTWVDETIEFLSEAQKSKLNDETRKFPPPVFLQLESRRIVFEKFRVARDDEKLRRAFLTQFFTEWDSLQSLEFQKARQAYFERVTVWIVEILQTMNEKQKKNLIKNLHRRAFEFQKLSIK